MPILASGDTKEPFSARCLTYGVTKRVPKPCDAELTSESRFSQKVRPPRGLPGGIFSLCKCSSILTHAHTCPSSMTARRSSPLSPGTWRVRGSAPTLLSAPHRSERPRSAARGCCPQGGHLGLCFPAGVAIKIPIVCVVLEGGPGTLDVRNCSRRAEGGGRRGQLLAKGAGRHCPCECGATLTEMQLRSRGVGLGLREGLLASGWD